MVKAERAQNINQKGGRQICVLDSDLSLQFVRNLKEWTMLLMVTAEREQGINQKGGRQICVLDSDL